ncbi:SRPBCC family protein [Zoogloea dura]|uniref:Rieske 2Fe-2S domain-containing protein n=1 Tax=Zoogloea dura TaxID=2728840 RepID=A0A848G515_9RHOO|nr:SRPBCC family protein [Zoogloea dura]NML26035.1 Rieske 2Fe-2S domain-containing protein [Zoogloea dura]
MCNANGDQPIRLKRRPIAQSIENLDELLSLEKGRMSRDVFWDKDIYEQEIERIFARCWLFVAHESQIPKAGDYVTTYMGEDNVLIVRQKDGSIKGFLNTCPHRGNKVCFADLGNARQFVCNYHGWAFGIDGGLKGMTASETYEAAGLDKSEHGLHPVAHIDSYRGLIFATLDPDAPSLADYLGDMRYYLDAIFDMDEGGTEFIGGCVKSVIQCNWKYASENFVGDILHALWTHDSGAKAMVGGPVAEVHKTPEQSYHVNFNGHGWEFNQDIVGNCATLGEKELLKYLYVLQPKVAERLGEVRSKMIGAISSCTLFPNTSFLPGQNTFRTWHPRGPGQIELHTWTFVNKKAPQEIKDMWRKGTMMTFSPSGVFEMDDGENWEYSTRSNAGFVTRQQDLYLGLGQDTRVEGTDLPGNVFQGQINEANQRAFYQRWLDLMKADSWKTVPQRDVPKMKEGV